MKCPGVHIVSLNLPLGWLFLSSPQRTQPSLDACCALGRPVAHVAHDPAENCPPASGLCLLGPLGPGRGQACRVGERRGPRRAEPHSQGPRATLGLQDGGWMCGGVPGGCCPLRPILTCPRPSHRGPSPAGGALCGLCGSSPQCVPLSLSGAHGLSSRLLRFHVVGCFHLSRAPTESDHSWRSPSAPGATPAPRLFFRDLTVLSGHLRRRHTGCFTVRSEGGPGLILLQRPARLLSVISPKPLAFLALNSGATLSFAKR